MPITEGAQDIPVKITGSSTFGRYETVSPARTYNMFITSADDGEEEWLVNFAGYASIKELVGTGAVGRGIFHSIRGNFIIAVVGTEVIRMDTDSSTPLVVGSIGTESVEVVIDENLANQICIVDGAKAYIYNYTAPSTFGEVVLTGTVIPTSSVFIPNYVTYQNQFFIFGNGVGGVDGSTWYVYFESTGQDLVYQTSLKLQTKPDYAIAALRIPGGGNNLLVLGTTVAEVWTQIPSLETYQRLQTMNIDYGCISVSTIGSSGSYVAWLGVNEKSSPAIMVMSGGQAQAQAISTDGIDYLLDRIQFPAQSTAFFFRQDGHLFYQLTFYNAADNLTIAYDFNTKKFFDLTNYNFNYHPARQVTYFQNELYFVSLNDGNLYELNSDLVTESRGPGLPDHIIPRIRVCPTFRFPRPEKFRVNLFTFVIESGMIPDVGGPLDCEGYIITEQTEAYIYTEDDLPILVEAGSCHGGVYSTTNPLGFPRVNISISKNGGITFSNEVSYIMHDTSNYQCQPRLSRVGVCNQFGLQLRFEGAGRFVVKNGVIEISS